MSHDGSGATGKRWFHALVVVGASLTSGAGCGSRHGLARQDAAHLPDGGSSSGGDTLGEAGMAGSDAFGGDEDAAAPPPVDAPVEYPNVLIIP